MKGLSLRACPGRKGARRARAGRENSQRERRQVLRSSGAVQSDGQLEVVLVIRHAQVPRLMIFRPFLGHMYRRSAIGDRCVGWVTRRDGTRLRVVDGNSEQGARARGKGVRVVVACLLRSSLAVQVGSERGMWGGSSCCSASTCSAPLYIALAHGTDHRES